MTDMSVIRIPSLFLNSVETVTIKAKNRAGMFSFGLTLIINFWGKTGPGLNYKTDLVFFNISPGREVYGPGVNNSKLLASSKKKLGALLEQFFLFF